MSILCGWAAIGPKPAIADDELPAVLKPHETRYEVWRRGSKLGELTLVLEAAGDGEFRYHGSTDATSRLARLLRVGAQEAIRFSWNGDGIVPLHYQLDTSAPGKSRFWEADFDWQAHRATRSGDTNQPVTAITEGVIDPLALRLKMAITLAGARPWESDLVFDVLERKRIETQTFRPQGFFRVTVPAGCMKALHMQRVREDSDRELHSWHAPALAWLPVRIRQLKNGKEQMDVQLAESDLLDGATASCE